MGAPRPQVLLTGDRLDLRWPPQVSCAELTAHCTLRDGSRHESDSWQEVGGGRFRTGCGPLRIELKLQPQDDCICVRAEAVGQTEVDVVAVAIAVRPRLAGSELSWVLYNGYQSWDPAGCLPADGAVRESWWTIGLANDRGAGIAAAATAARGCCTKFEVSDGVFHTTWRETESLEPGPSLFAGPAGTRWRSEAVLLGAGPDVRACLASMFVERAPTSPVPVGWNSWYHHGPLVRREDLLTHAELLAGPTFRELGYRLVQLDDGWHQTYGEWLPNVKFPGGLAALCEDLRRHGQVPGLWTAPFLVSAAADLASEAPEAWFLTDPATGVRAVDPRHVVFGPMYILDPSQPAVRAHLREVFTGFYDAGVRYFKVDFLYAGAYAGTRAFRAGLEAIREGARDAQIVASGAPLLPVVGLVEGCRVGQDTATPWPDFETGTSQPVIFGQEVQAVARNAAARCQLHPWFWVDADVALVGGNLTLEQGRQLATVAALSGGPFFASDDLFQLAPERLALLTNPEVLELVGQGTAIPDWEPGVGDRPPTHWRRRDVLAVFNWSDAPARCAVRAPGARGARDLWERRELERFGDGTVLSVPAHGVRLLRTR